MRAVLADDASSIEVLRGSDETSIVTQVAREDFRPYLHPILAPDGSEMLSEFRPRHHPHQTGLYWGFTDVNGRDYFHHPKATHWRRVSVTVLKGRAEQPGDAVRDVTIGEHDYGGLFLRMPWRPGVKARAVNSARQADARAEGQRATWLALGIEIGKRGAMTHVAILDHPNNPGFPTPWRVDPQYGVGPAPTRLGPRTVPAGKSLGYQYRLLIYSGELDDVAVTDRRPATGVGSGVFVRAGCRRFVGFVGVFLRLDDQRPSVQDPGPVAADRPDLEFPDALDALAVEIA